MVHGGMPADTHTPVPEMQHAARLDHTQADQNEMTFRRAGTYVTV